MGVYPEAWAEHGLSVEELRLLDIRLNVAWRQAGYSVPRRPDRSPELPWEFEGFPGRHSGTVQGSLWGPGGGVFMRSEVLHFHVNFCKWRWLFCDRGARLHVIEAARRVFHALGIDQAIWLSERHTVEAPNGATLGLDDIRGELRRTLGPPQPSLLDTDPSLAAVAEKGQVDVWFDEAVSAEPVLSEATMQLRSLEAAPDLDEYPRRSAPAGRDIGLRPRELLALRLVDLAIASESELRDFGRVEERVREASDTAAPVDVILSVHAAEDGGLRIAGEVVGCTDKAAQLGQRRAFLRRPDGRIVPPT